VALSEKHALTQQDIAKAVGKDRSTVANVMRLLKLPPSVRKLVEDGSLTQGHARALLTLEDEVMAGELGRRAAQEGWSVREIERRVGGRARERVSRKTKTKSPSVRALEEALQDHLMTKVDVREGRGGKGAIEIKFHGVEDFERLFELITGRRAQEVVE